MFRDEYHIGHRTVPPVGFCATQSPDARFHRPKLEYQRSAVRGQVTQTLTYDCGCAYLTRSNGFELPEEIISDGRGE